MTQTASKYRRRSSWTEALEARLAMTSFPPAQTIIPDSDAAMSVLSMRLLPGEQESVSLELDMHQRVSFKITSRQGPMSADDAQLIAIRLDDPDFQPTAEEPSVTRDGSLFWDEYTATKAGTFTLQMTSYAEWPLDLEVVAVLDVDWTEISSVSDEPLAPLRFVSADESPEETATLFVDSKLNGGERVHLDFSEPESILGLPVSVSSSATGRVEFEPEGIEGGSLSLRITGEDPHGPELRPNTLLFVYDSRTGNFKVKSLSKQLTALEIRSPSGLFTGPKPSVIGQNPFDIYTLQKIFVLGVDSQYELAPRYEYDFGPILAPGLAVADLRTAFWVTGAILGSGGAYEYVVRDAQEPDEPILSKHATTVSAWLDLGTIDPTQPRFVSSLDFMARLETSGDAIESRYRYQTASVRFSVDAGWTWEAKTHQLSCEINADCAVDLPVPSGDHVLAEIRFEGAAGRLLLDHIVAKSHGIASLGAASFRVTLEDGEYLDLQANDLGSSLCWDAEAVGSGLGEDRECADRSIGIKKESGQGIGYSEGRLTFRDKTQNGQPDTYVVTVGTSDRTLIHARKSKHWLGHALEGVAPHMSKSFESILLFFGPDVDQTTCTGLQLQSPGVEWQLRYSDTNPFSIFVPAEALREGEISVTLPAGVCKDLLGNPTVEVTKRLDHIPPKLISAQSPSSYQFTSGMAYLHFSFDEPVMFDYMTEGWYLTTPMGENQNKISIPPNAANSYSTSWYVALPLSLVGTYVLHPTRLIVSDRADNTTVVVLPETTIEVVASTLPEGRRKFDLDKNDRVDLNDLELLQNVIDTQGKAIYFDSLDLDRDRTIDSHDESEFIEKGIGFRKGDVNLDGVFDELDLLQVAAAYNQAERGWEQGDVNEDGFVDSADLIAAFQVGGYASGALPGDIVSLQTTDSHRQAKEIEE